jgi:predicted metal-dependent phosphotriesterase family hydrolase
MDKTAEEEIKALKTFDKILKAAMSPFSALSMASDNVIRQAVYSQIMLETGDAARAAHSAEEIIHFRRTGSYGFVNLVRQYVPFVNANLQALHVTASTIAADGINHATRGEAMQRFMVQGAQLIAATLLYTAMKSDDDEYKKQDPSERDRFLIVNEDFKLPMRNDLFTWLFKIVPEHMFNRYVAESEDSTKLVKALKEGLIKALATPSAIPTLITPFVEAKYNINTVTGRPLVGQGQEGLEAELQYSPKYTTELGKIIG